jgi:predicted NBD/HSP70 family sugar kinase
LDLFATLQSAGFEIKSVSDFDHMQSKFRIVTSKWIWRAAAQLEPLINNAFAWLDPGAVVISSSLPIDLLNELADELNKMEMFQRSDWAKTRQVGVSKLGRSASTFGAALLPIHAVAQL